MVAWYIMLLTAFAMFEGYLSVAHAKPVGATCPNAETAQQGKPHSGLLGLYDTGDSRNAPIRPDLVELFSGCKKNVSFDYIWPRTQKRFHHTSMSLRQGTITVAGKARDTMVSDLGSRSIGAWDSNALIHSLHWFDPTNGIRIETRYHFISETYQGMPVDYADFSVVVSA
jgi:hypothetical protein